MGRTKDKDNDGDIIALAGAIAVYGSHRRKLGIEHPEISREMLRKHCADGRLPAIKLGKTWLVTRGDVKRFAERNYGPGPGGVPRKVVKHADR
jgi:excisionase family DNA binding protein